MKAIIVTKYGGTEVLKIMDVPTPTPKDSEILVKIHAAAVNNTDPVFRKGKPFISRFFTGLIKPKQPIPGDVLAGEVVAVGKDVADFQVGDRVYGYTTDALGAHAQFICLPEDCALTTIPDNISYEQAAGIVDGGHTALAFLRDKGAICKGQKVLVYGASGSVGTAAVQLSKSFSAEVTGVCSAKNIELVRSLGAKRAINYKEVDFTQEDVKYDIIFDTVAKKSFVECKHVLSENGVYLTTFPTPNVLVKGLFQSKSKGKRALFVGAGMKSAKEKRANLQYISKLLKEEKIKVVISKNYSMDNIADAHKYVETGHKVGSVILGIYSESE